MPEAATGARAALRQSRSDNIRVVLDARIWDGASGGVQQWVIGLASGLSSLGGEDEYLFLVDQGGGSWLEPYVSEPSRIVTTTRTKVREGRFAAVRSDLAGRLPRMRALWRRARATRTSSVRVPASDGTIERLGADVVHFTFQEGFLTDVPSLYQPWDLQHLHLPSFFSAGERKRREVVYRSLCAQATTVIAATKWVRRDLVAQYKIPAERVVVINVPPVTSAYPPASAERVSEVRRRYGLEGRFVLYPAQTWPHKNHLRLFEALGLLRRRGMVVPLVCSGARNERHGALVSAARRAGIGSQVHFVGFIAPEDLQALYSSARALVFPSLYEGWGLPIVEAFRHGLPVACSNVTSLPELVEDAALLFDPMSSEAIAASIARLWTEDELVASLAERGRRRAALFTWERTARTLRAHYRRVAGRQLEPDDEELMRESALV